LRNLSKEWLFEEITNVKRRHDPSSLSSCNDRKTEKNYILDFSFLYNMSLTSHSRIKWGKKNKVTVQVQIPRGQESANVTHEMKVS